MASQPQGSKYKGWLRFFLFLAAFLFCMFFILQLLTRNMKSGQGVHQPPGVEKRDDVDRTEASVATVPQFGSLEIVTIPPETAVLFDGRNVGVTPLIIEGVTPGEHTLVLEKKCHRKKEAVLAVKNEEKVLEFVLDAICGDLEVKSIPPGADIIANGRKYGVTPYTMSGVRPGKLTLQVRLKKAVYKWTVNIVAGKTTSREVDFRRPAVPRPGNIWQDPQTGVEFVRVSGGCYSMGNLESEILLQEQTEKNNNPVGYFFQSVFDVVTDSAEEEDAVDYDVDEAPVHEVCIDDLWVGRKEIVNDQYMPFAKETGTKPEWLKKENKFNVETGDSEYYKQLGGEALSAGSNPVVGVTWNDAISFSNWFSKKTGFKARLLTEAEWEYMCRSGGGDEKFSGGSAVNDFGWHIGNSDNKIHPAGLLQANNLNLYDLSGNVWEWNMDHYDPKAYASHTKQNPLQTESDDSRMVVRGGSWRSKENSLRCMARYGLPAEDAHVFLGFRIVMTGEEKNK